MSGATPAQLEKVKQMLLAHDWRFMGIKQGDVITRARKDAPDDGQHMEERRQPDRMKFRRGEQFASIGPGTAAFWRFTSREGQTDLKKLKTVQTEKIQALLDERSPLSPAARERREKERQQRVLTEQAKRAIGRR